MSEEVGSENAPPQQPAQQQQQQQQPGALSSELQRQADGGAGSAAGGSPHAGPPAPLHGGYALPPHHNPAASLRMLTAGSLWVPLLRFLTMLYLITGRVKPSICLALQCSVLHSLAPCVHTWRSLALLCLDSGRVQILTAQPLMPLHDLTTYACNVH